MKLNGRDYSLDTFRGDLFGGVTSAVVTLPVALAFGVATGHCATCRHGSKTPDSWRANERAT